MVFGVITLGAIIFYFNPFSILLALLHGTDVCGGGIVVVEDGN